MCAVQDFVTDRRQNKRWGLKGPSNFQKNIKVQWLQGSGTCVGPLPPLILMVCAPLGRGTRQQATIENLKLDRE